MNHDTQPGLGYEPRDAQLKPLIQFMVWLSIGSVLVAFAMYWTLRGFQRLPTIDDAEDPHPLAAQNDPIPPAPHLEMQRGVKIGWDGKLIDQTARQPFTTSMWKDLQAQASERIGSYGWVDEQAKIVHIPIERAMDLALQKGFPTAPARPGN